VLAEFRIQMSRNWSFSCCSCVH